MTRNVSDDASNPNKTALVGNDRFKIVNSEANPNSYEEILQSNVASAASDINTGTSVAKFLTPDALAGSNPGTRLIFLPVADPSTTPSTGDSKAHVPIPSYMNGMDIVGVQGCVTTPSSSGTPTFALRRLRSGSAVDVLSTLATIDINEYTTDTAATPAVINTSNDDLATGDILLVDLDVVGTGAKGHGLLVAARLP